MDLFLILPKLSSMSVNSNKTECVPLYFCTRHSSHMLHLLFYVIYICKNYQKIYFSNRNTYSSRYCLKGGIEQKNFYPCDPYFYIPFQLLEQLFQLLEHLPHLTYLLTLEDLKDLILHQDIHILAF